MPLLQYIRGSYESYGILFIVTLTDDVSGMRFSVDLVVSEVSEGDDAASSWLDCLTESAVTDAVSAISIMLATSTSSSWLCRCCKRSI